MSIRQLALDLHSREAEAELELQRELISGMKEEYRALASRSGHWAYSRR